MGNSPLLESRLATRDPRLGGVNFFHTPPFSMSYGIIESKNCDRSR